MIAQHRGALRRWRPSLAVYLFGLVVLVVAGVSAVLALQQSRNLEDVRATTAQRAQFQASVAARDVSQAVALTETSVESLAANPALDQMLTAAGASGCTLSFTGTGPFARGHIDVVDGDGTVRCSSSDSPEGPVYADAAWLEVGAGDPVIFGPVDDPTVDAAVLVVAAPVPGRGMVATFLELHALEERLAESLGGPLGFQFDVIDALEPSRSTSRADDRITGQAAISRLGWTVRASVDEEAATAGAREHNEQLLFLVLVGTAALTLAAFVAYRWMVRPIERLSAALRSVMAGDDVALPPASGPAEVASLVETFGTLNDVVRRELELRRGSERRYRTLFDAKPQPTWVHDCDTGALLEVNRAMEALFGRSRDELLAMRVDDLLPEQTADGLSALLAGSDDVERTGPWKLVGRDGEGVECQITSAVLDLADGSGRLVIAEDVSDRLRTERLLHQAQRMESLGQLAGGIAHDFNNMLAVMLSYAEFVGEELERAAEEDPQRWGPVLTDVAHIGDAGQRAVELTQQLLSFARGKPSDVGAVDLNAVAAEVGQMLRRTLGGQIDLELVLAPALSPVTANEGQLQQVVLNLAVNARDAMPTGGRLLIETAEIDLGAEDAKDRPGLEPGRHVRLRVSDTGVGMDAETRNRALEPFFTTKGRGTGTGLGLATVYGVVSGAGGVIQIYSEPGLGTSINILLPVQGVPPSEVAASGAETAPGTSAATVLVVEDDDDIREVAERLLTRAGYRVLCAPDGDTALAMDVEALADVDLLLTDMVMPEMLGSELARRLQALEPAIRVLFMSGYAPPLLAHGGALPPHAAVVDKPFTRDQLIEMVQAALGSP